MASFKSTFSMMDIINVTKFCLRMMNLKAFYALLIVAVIGIGCSASSSSDSNSVKKLSFDSDNAGLTLPTGFKALKVADSLGSARHIAVAENGDMYIALRRANNGGGIVALRDTDNDGIADQKEYFGDHAGTGIGIHDGYLYASSTTKVFRYKMIKNSLVPTAEPEVVIEGFPDQRQHAAKSFTFDNSGNIYVNVGAPSNSCQEQDRSTQSPGQDPCPLLERHAGIWQFSATELGQTQQQDGVRYATGLRNVVGLEWNEAKNSLYVTQHGRDQLSQNWPDLYTQKENAELPAETLYKVSKGDNFGWPYSYYDQRKNALMLAPEYGGDGEIMIANTEYAGQFKNPVKAFPGHWAPNALTFYDATQFSEKFRNGALIAFHGSWNRAPLPQQGYKVVYAPLDGSASNFSDFATGFPGSDQPQPGNADHRPTGLTVGPDGTLYITDDSQGTVWRVAYTGESEE
jgi:glucose/arabinose dehydrogenase